MQPEKLQYISRVSHQELIPTSYINWQLWLCLLGQIVRLNLKSNTPPPFIKIPLATTPGANVGFVGGKWGGRGRGDFKKCWNILAGKFKTE